MRDVLDERDFLEIETPILTRSTPEGARDFLVPSRLQPGSWYALPQSPQLFKQLLMMSGYERYYQIARCFRDEDLRADRQPEFTQLDVEMAFVDEDDVIDDDGGRHGRGLRGRPASTCRAPPWPRMAYDEAMLRFGSDRPDRRFGLEIVDVSEALRGSEFKVFESVLGGGGAVRALNAGAREMSRSELDGAQRGRPAPRRQGGRVGRSSRTAAWRSPIAKFLGEDRVAAARRRAAAPPRATCCSSSPTSRASRPRRSARCAWSSAGASASSPRAATTSCGSSTSRCSSPPTTALGRGAPPVHRAERRLRRSRARCARAPTTSIVDGWELGGGSIRINTPEVQEQVFKVIGMSEEEGRRRFGFLLDALQVRRAAARRHRDGHRPRRGAARRPRLDPRRHRLPQDGLAAATR